MEPLWPSAPGPAPGWESPLGAFQTLGRTCPQAGNMADGLQGAPPPSQTCTQTLGTWSGQYESMGGGRVELELELETKGAW